jgi:alkylation response protein AidB-like acyl-CoA dehydrogenase
VDFRLSSEQQGLQHRCRDLAADFATRSAANDRDASHPSENCDRLREEGFLALTIGKEWGGLGTGLLDRTVAYEALGAGCRRRRLRSTCMPRLSPKTRVANLSENTHRRSPALATVKPDQYSAFWPGPK